MQGTQEHDDTARAIALSWGKGMKRPGLELGWRGKGETLWLHSPRPRKHL